ncbi:GNAT family acetyltransferase [Dictyobacter vulcani]|uniref:GNAT family acetyltransferase n=1 Tax=Dictyobacter vulcani TaxID=2607529 RepID=A0A5J4KT06_9CHLR|nr:GNAT family N-acetyltransferase [Dictyobacter vulcani]GER89547.1 GNAT family acetyltransferase [Dictyobacter vulcani]
MYPHLRRGYSVRNPTSADMPAIIQLLYDFDYHETGEADFYQIEDIENDWQSLDVSRDAWVVIAEDGLLCGYATLTFARPRGRLFADGYVHPRHYNNGIGTTLIELMEARAAEIVQQEPMGTRLVLVNNIIATSSASIELLEKLAYTLTRAYLRMGIVLTAPPATPAWPSNIVLRTCDGSLEDIYRVYEVAEESFSDHWAHPPQSFEEWKKHHVRESFNPDLWFLALDGEQIAGVALCRDMEEHKGWVSVLGVRRQWRQHGLGTALLHHSFAVFYQRQRPAVNLVVDSQSLTGAQRIYERAGMHVTMRMGRYEKELRPGKDLQDE